MLRIRLEVTAPFRGGGFASMLVAERTRPEGPVHAAKSMEAESLGRAEESRLARSATRGAGLALTPSAAQAARTFPMLDLNVGSGSLCWLL